MQTKSEAIPESTKIQKQDSAPKNNHFFQTNDLDISNHFWSRLNDCGSKEYEAL